MKNIITILFISFFVINTSYCQLGRDRPGPPGHDLPELTERMQAIKIALMTKELDLSVDESKAFWPIYNEGQEQLKSLRLDTRPKKKIENLTDEEAIVIINRFIANEEKRLEIHKAMIQKLIPVIGAKRVLKIRKVENSFKRKILKRAGKGKRKGQKHKGGRKSGL
jgi:hypothetical protein